MFVIPGSPAAGPVPSKVAFSAMLKTVSAILACRAMAISWPTVIARVFQCRAEARPMNCCPEAGLRWRSRRLEASSSSFLE
jgi:hypothetical protein